MACDKILNDPTPQAYPLEISSDTESLYPREVQTVESAVVS